MRVGHQLALVNEALKRLFNQLFPIVQVDETSCRRTMYPRLILAPDLATCAMLFTTPSGPVSMRWKLARGFTLTKQAIFPLRSK